MKSTKPIAGRPAYYSTTETAWILGIDLSAVHRAIRIGALPAVRRRSRLVVPAAALHRLLGAASDGANRQDGGDA
jgi:hypothetical protein